MQALRYNHIKAFNWIYSFFFFFLLQTVKREVLSLIICTVALWITSLQAQNFLQVAVQGKTNHFNTFPSWTTPGDRVYVLQLSRQNSKATGNLGNLGVEWYLQQPAYGLKKKKKVRGRQQDERIMYRSQQVQNSYEFGLFIYLFIYQVIFKLRMMKRPSM